MRKINEIIIHASATDPNWFEGRSVSDKVKEIRRWHIERSFYDIGYHFIIDRDGATQNGRQIEKEGAHCKRHNDNSIGICLIGGKGGDAKDLATEHYTKEQLDSLRKLIEELKENYGINKVTGHNIYSDKACPCFNVKRWYAKKQTKQKFIKDPTVQGGAVAATATSLLPFVNIINENKNIPYAQYILLAVALIGIGLFLREKYLKR